MYHVYITKIRLPNTFLIIKTIRDQLYFFGNRGKNKEKNVFQKCSSLHDILPHNGNRSEEEDLKIKAEWELEEKQCDKKIIKICMICHAMRVDFLTEAVVRRKGVTGGRCGSSAVLSHCCLSFRLLPEKGTRGTVSPERTTHVGKGTAKTEPQAVREAGIIQGNKCTKPSLPRRFYFVYWLCYEIVDVLEEKLLPQSHFLTSSQIPTAQLGQMFEQFPEL